MKYVMILLLAGMFSIKASAQVGKDTVKTDSLHMEKIKKMPMDTMHHKTPVKPILREEQRDKRKEDPIDPNAPIGKKTD